MQGDKQQIKELRMLYNQMLEEKHEYERKLRMLDTAFGIKHGKKVADIWLRILDLQVQMIDIDKTINQLSGL